MQTQWKSMGQEDGNAIYNLQDSGAVRLNEG